MEQIVDVAADFVSTSISGIETNKKLETRRKILCVIQLKSLINGLRNSLM